MEEAWLDFPQPEIGETSVRHTRRAVGPTSKEMLARELVTLKAMAYNMQQARIQASVGMWTMQLPAEIIQKPLGVAKEFAKAHAGKSKHKFGSPHIQVWRAFLKVLIEETTKIAENKGEQEKSNLIQCKNIIETELKAMETEGPSMGHKHIRQCRMKVCREPEKGLCHFAVSHLVPNMREVDLAIHMIVENLGGTVLPGTAPPNELERQVQVNIDAVKAELAAM